MKQNMLLLLAAIVVLVSSLELALFAQDNQNAVDNSMGQAYAYLSDKDVSKAKEMFVKAGELATNDDNWRSLIEASQGLIVCGDFTQAKNFLDIASDLLDQNYDSQAQLALAYGIMGLPPDRREALHASIPISRAYSIASKSEDWYVLTEVAKLSFALDDDSKALDALSYAVTIAKRRKDAQACLKLSTIYEKYNYPDNAYTCRQLAESYKEEQKADVPPPPPGWSAAGESVAGPPEIDPEVGKAIRASADQQISDKREWMLEQKRIEAEQHSTYQTYSYFYTYPYDYPYDGYYIYEYDDRDLRGWCDYRLSRYHYVDGVYIRIGD